MVGVERQNIAMMCGNTGAANTRACLTSQPAWPAAQTCTPPRGRRPSASINFITAHDGFTLADLVAYDHKHNEANGEDNRDGESHNQSWNSGVEGPSAEQSILQIRNARRRSMLATLLLSQGVSHAVGR